MLLPKNTPIEEALSPEVMASYVDRGYALKNEIALLEKELESIKHIFKTTARVTGITEWMGVNSKCVVASRSTTEIAPRPCHKLLKKNGQEALFWGMIKVSVTEARKVLKDDLEEVSTTVVDQYNAVYFK